MQTFNQTILNSMIEKALDLLQKSNFNDFLALFDLRSIPFSINTRMRTKGGVCSYLRQRSDGKISNIKIEICYQYALVATEEEIYNTVAHELAHAYELILTGKTDHGILWQKIHTSMGGTAERCHTVDVQRNQVQRHKILDRRDGKIYVLTTRRWNKISFLKLSDGKDRFVKQDSFIKPQMAMA